MNRLLAWLRFRWALATHSFGFGLDLTRQLYRIYLNHTKVIHYRGGCPVYSLTTPALFSSPAAHFLARALYRTIQNRNLPNLLSLAVNDVCNAACEHCSFFSAVWSSTVAEGPTVSFPEKYALIHSPLTCAVMALLKFDTMPANAMSRLRRNRGDGGTRKRYSM